MAPATSSLTAITLTLDTIAISSDDGRMATYPGGKGGAGVYQTLINLIPPHDTYIETHLGGGAVMRHKQPANHNIGIDVDPYVIEHWQAEEHTGIELVCGDAVAFLESYQFTGRELVYADPPYILETRRGGQLYRYEYTTKQHRQLLRSLTAETPEEAVQEFKCSSVHHWATSENIKVQEEG